MTTLGGKTSPNKVPIQESWAIALGFDGTDDSLTLGTPVKLNSDETVEIADAASDFPIGIVVSGGKGVYDRPERVTVQTIFAAEEIAVADGAVVAGNFLKCTGKNSDGILKYHVATTGWAVGMALVNAADTVSLRLAILRSPVAIPAVTP